MVPGDIARGDIDAVALWEPQPHRAGVALGADAIEFRDTAVYVEKFNLCTTQRNLGDPALRRRITGFVRDVIAAARRLEADPEAGCRLVAKAAGLDIDTVRGSWSCFSFPGTLAPDLLDAFDRQEPWIAKIQGRAARSRQALARLIDDSVLREARSG
jgi:NitT/TauT family transport system substrate-binding protein